MVDKKSRKRKGEKYEHVLALIKSKGGNIDADDPDLVTLLGGPVGTEGSVLYRLATYISYIRRFAKLEVIGIRAAEKDPVLGHKRKVVRYELGDPIDDDGPLVSSGDCINGTIA